MNLQEDSNFGQRHNLCAGITNSTVFLRRPAESDSLQFLQRKRQEAMVDRGEEVCSFWGEGKTGYGVTSTASTRTNEFGEYYSNRYRPSKISKRELYQFLSLNRFTAIEFIFSSLILLHSELSFLIQNDRIVENVVERYRISCFILNIKDIINIYNNRKINIMNSCLQYNISKYYYNPDESFEISAQFLRFQISNNNIGNTFYLFIFK